MEQEHQNSVGVILAAGGIGSRMQSSIPKQFIHLNGKPMIQHSLDLFSSMPEIAEIVIVCAPEYRHLISLINCQKRVTFTSPGERRQDSVYNGLNAMQEKASMVCVHDAARPYIKPCVVKRVIQGAIEYGAAVAAMPVKFTIKEGDSEGMVIHTPDRSKLWEIQTPQIVKRSLLEAGFECANKNHLTVTDDVSLVELLGHPVRLVEGCYSNIKITTPEDLIPTRDTKDGGAKDKGC